MQITSFAAASGGLIIRQCGTALFYLTVLNWNNKNINNGNWKIFAATLGQIKTLWVVNPLLWLSIRTYDTGQKSRVRQTRIYTRHLCCIWWIFPYFPTNFVVKADTSSRVKDVTKRLSGVSFYEANPALNNV